MENWCKKNMVQKSNFVVILSPFWEARETKNDARSPKMTFNKKVEKKMKKWGDEASGVAS